MQVTTKNGIKVKLKRNTTPKYADEFNRCSIANKMYKGEIVATSEDITLVYAEGKEENLIIAVDPKNVIIDCEAWDWEDPVMGDFPSALLAIRKRHNLNS